MWILILTAIHLKNYNDIPAEVRMSFFTESACIHAQQTLSYTIKYSNYKIVSQCQKESL